MIACFVGVVNVIEQQGRLVAGLALMDVLRAGSVGFFEERAIASQATSDRQYRIETLECNPQNNHLDQIRLDREITQPNANRCHLD